MNENIFVDKYDPTPANEPYFIALGCVGYESRSSYAVKKFSPDAIHKFALVFGYNQVLDFAGNQRVFSKHKFVEIPATESSVEIEIVKAANLFPKTSAEAMRVWVDISSMTRPLIARICYTLYHLANVNGIRIIVHYIYSHAEFSFPQDDYGPVVHKGAVIPELSGWTDDPSEPCSAIFGLGYEVGLALGALEDIEPGEAWAFKPTGHDVRYEKKVQEANREFFEIIPKDHVFEYDIGGVYGLYIDLELMVFGSLQQRRVVLIPFGLKFFALCSFVVALQHFPNVSVWRVSGGRFIAPFNRAATGVTSGLCVCFAPLK
jgi:hypothetical protein